jgi:hypothetical protein
MKTDKFLLFKSLEINELLFVCQNSIFFPLKLEIIPNAIDFVFGILKFQ